MNQYSTGYGKLVLQKARILQATKSLIGKRYSQIKQDFDLTVLARRSKEGSVAGARVAVPQVGADAVVLARVGVALVLPGTTRFSVDLLHAPLLLLLEVVLSDLHFVDDDVLDAADERRGVVGQDLLVADDAADEGVEEDGVVVAARVDRLSGLKLVVDAEGQVRRVDGDVDLLPLGVVQVLADNDALVFGDQVGVEVEAAVLQLEAEVGVALTDGHKAVADRRSELHVELVTFRSVRHQK